MSVELLDEGPDDVETDIIAWLVPMLSNTVNARRSGDPLPQIVVVHLDGNESIQESHATDLVSVHILSDKASGRVAARNIANDTHRRLLQLGRYLEDIDLVGGRKATISSLSVFTRPHWEEYGDDQILQKVGRYTVGLPYARIS